MRQEFERSNGYSRALADDPLTDYRSHNESVLKPHGVWAVIAPFNFPLALMAGPTAAALVTGNTVVAKGATDTPWAGRLLADCIRDAGVPPGVFNYLTGSGSVAGEALVSRIRTWPGSPSPVRTRSACTSAAAWSAGAYPAAVHRRDGRQECRHRHPAMRILTRAVPGIVRSAFGLSGQKCSALSRVYVEDAVADTLIGRLRTAIGELAHRRPAAARELAGPGHLRIRRARSSPATARASAPAARASS